jgi:antirestriction protein ArdC
LPEDEKHRAAETGQDAQAISFLKRFTIFNTDQCENLPEDVATVAPLVPEGLIEPTVETLIEATGIDFRIGRNRAFYVRPTTMCRCRRRSPTSNDQLASHRAARARPLCRTSDYAA